MGSAKWNLDFLSKTPFQKSVESKSMLQILILLLVSSSFLIIVSADSNSKSGKKGTILDELDEPTLNKLLTMEKYKNVYKTDLEKSKLKKILFGPFPGDDEEIDENEFLDSYVDALSDGIFQDRTIYSLSESLEFSIDVHNRAKASEKKIDEVLEKRDVLRKSLDLHKQTESQSQKLAALYLRSKPYRIIIQADGPTVGPPEHMDMIREIDDEKERLMGLDEDIIKAGEEINEALKAFEMLTIEMNMENEKLADMASKFMKEIIGFSKASGIEVNSMNVTGFRGEVVIMDVKILDSLLKKYQKLEGLRNNLLLAKDTQKKLEIEEEIKKLEEETIPEYVKENRVQIGRFTQSTLGTVMRNMKKLFLIDHSLNNLEEQINKTNKAVEAFMATVREYYRGQGEWALRPELLEASKAMLMRAMEDRKNKGIQDYIPEDDEDKSEERDEHDEL